MRLIDAMMMNIGAVFLIAGGVLLVSALFGFAIHLVGKIWIAASNKWRRILRAESLIYEYRQNQDEFLRWKHATTVDAVPVVRCEKCIHYEMGVCLKIYDNGAASRYAWQERKPDDFCSYGEKKEGADGCIRNFCSN